MGNARQQQNLCAADHNLEKRCSAQIFQPLSQTRPPSPPRRERKLFQRVCTMEINFSCDFIEFTPFTDKKWPGAKAIVALIDEAALKWQAVGWFLLSDYNVQKVGAAINMISWPLGCYWPAGGSEREALRLSFPFVYLFDARRAAD